MKCIFCGDDNSINFYVRGELFRACELCGNFWMITSTGEPFRYELFMQNYPYCSLIDVQYDDIHGGGIPELAVLKKGSSPTALGMLACVKAIDLWLFNQDLANHRFPTWVLKLLDDGWEADYPMLAKLKGGE